jgi:formate hydrogenlyase subunit 6/NADH:ubiquinone oxidoreductase subunit I
VFWNVEEDKPQICVYCAYCAPYCPYDVIASEEIAEVAHVA